MQSVYQGRIRTRAWIDMIQDKNWTDTDTVWLERKWGHLLNHRGEISHSTKMHCH